jgi:hypothetical protein
MAAADGVFTPFVIDTSVALNVSWFIRFVYSSGTSVTQYITSPSLPSDPSQQPIIGITNSQNIPIPAGLQVMWQAPISSLQSYFSQYGINLNNDLSNMRILYNGQYVPAWIESINNDIATIWMKMPVSIPANSSIALSLNAGPSFNFDGVYWGEAPQLSPTYGQYDNGASVFNNYWNFAGTSLPNDWSATSSFTGSVNNGITLTSDYDWAGITQNSASLYSNVIIDTYVKEISYQAFMVGLSQDQAYGGSSWPIANGYGFILDNSGRGDYDIVKFVSSNGNILADINFNTILDTYYIFSNYFISPNLNQTINYNSVSLSTFDNTYSSLQYLSLTVWYGANWTVNWLRIRAYPPNGVMPSVSLL